MNWLFARLAEPSTHAGLAAVAGGAAMLVPPSSPWHQLAVGIAVALGGTAAVKADKSGGGE